ncbi:tRNA (N(6)-L-threonylcarbamoyladenosine(37)-C(2))-methylthiotransferase [Candidatus Woesearchaeota archaeon]|nr:MAG: tRNA (N(6)-L-threonylcarbamoyladenosine(37)-C(2))-methylthiotransferase [Candidatus Woesearchaeota archaeon]
MKIKIITFGCSNNLAEAEVMAGLLKSAGHEIVENGEDLRVVNVCSVKGPSLNKGLKEVRSSPVPVIVTGCIPKEEVDNIKSIRHDISLLSTHNIEKIVDVAEYLFDGITTINVEKKNMNKVCLPKLRKNSMISVVPISSGCYGSCSYCSVKLIKGDLFSYDKELVVKEVKDSLNEGCKEIWLTSQDNGAYGLDKNSSLPELLNEILKIKKDFKVRLGMTNPQYVCKYLNEFIEIFRDEKMFKFLHMPLQSGSNRVLKDMNRPYKVEDYLKAVKMLKQHHPMLTVSTDIIVGYPIETEEDFNLSLHVIKDSKPDVLNLTRYWPRPNTPAAKYKMLDGTLVKQRVQRALEIFKEIALKNNLGWVGWSGDVLIDEAGKNGTFIGRNFAYKPVIVKGDYELGQKVKVKIKKVTAYELFA